MKTFSVQTLGCKVNQYEGEQLATLLRARGLVPAPDPARADLRIVHTCSVTVHAAGKSRQAVRRTIRLPLWQETPADAISCPNFDVQSEPSAILPDTGGAYRPRVVVTGCWATSDREAALALPGVDAVLTNHDDVAADLDRLLNQWQGGRTSAPPNAGPQETFREPLPKSFADDGWIKEAGTPAGPLTRSSKATVDPAVKEKPNLLRALTPSPGTPAEEPLASKGKDPHPSPLPAYRAREWRAAGSTGLPVLGEHQVGRQRAFLKVQDGCDAHCTYCIIPKLRPRPWSKSVDVAVGEARALVASGHAEIVLTGIFLGAYGQPTALRRRQPVRGAQPIGELVDALCTRVPGLGRLRLSSLEPGDLTDDLVRVLCAHPQVVPHFHLPLQSGSDLLLRRMNRQYTRDDFFRMLDRVHAAFDRPALTTDVIVGFPGETDDEFERTVEVVNAARFIHVHAFSFSPRPGTAAARWSKDFVRGTVVNERVERLTRLSAAHSVAFRRQFLGETVELFIETGPDGAATRHGRSERYFDVTVPGAGLRTGDFIRARVSEVTAGATFGEVVQQ